MGNRWIFSFDEIDKAEKRAGSWDGVRALLGGKGANLGEMTRLGFPVPPGFTLTTEACNAYLREKGRFPPGMWDEVLAAMAKLEKPLKKAFGGADNPLLVSCRSGAKFSMPGMMDTVLNIGLNDSSVKGMIKLTKDPRFVYDLYRRLIQMFASVVLNVSDEPFEEILSNHRKKSGVKSDSELTAEDWQKIIGEFKAIIKKMTGDDFPQDPIEQLKMAIEAVFKSWNGKRAVDYRNAAHIPHDLGTGVNIQAMAFGNMGVNSATGVATTRNVSNGKREIEGDYLINAQGEDVVAGIRMTKPIQELKKEMPASYLELEGICSKLENHYRDVQDIEFTIEEGKLWMLQTRDSKRTAAAAVKIAVDMVEEGLITKKEALERITPEQIDFFLHMQFEEKFKHRARIEGRLIASGLNVSPGAAVGQVVFDADLAEKWQNEGRQVIMVRPETKPDDVHGMLASEGILTSRGGRTSHAALVARQFGKPAVVGVSTLHIDLNKRQMFAGQWLIKEGEWLSLDGNSGDVYRGKLKTVIPDINDPMLIKFLSWADEFRKLSIRANADYPEDARRAREYGAEGIGLCRTEHMFFQTDRLPSVQKMILTDNKSERKEALDFLLTHQIKDFEGLFMAMQGFPVVIRLIDPPLHEFLPNLEELLIETTELRIKNSDPALLREKEKMLAAVKNLSEMNPMLGLRGVRLGIHMPEIISMQIEAIITAACRVSKKRIKVKPEIMIPLICHSNELKIEKRQLNEIAKEVMQREKTTINYKFGAMIEIPRAALIASEIASIAEFVSFGTNDLTQTVFGISRDDAEAGFLIEYIEKGILEKNPFQSIDPKGVGRLLQIAVREGRKKRKELVIGICGEHGGDPDSISLCHQYGLDYVSCSPFRVPVARLAAAKAAL